MRTLPISIEFTIRDPRQRKIHDLLNRLVSNGSADFYFDACRLIETSPSFNSTSHLVAHLFREIESSLRAVLLGIAEPKETSILKKENADRHKKSIKLIMTTLGIPESEDTIKIWIEEFTSGKDLSKDAHRANLESPRPIEDFKERIAKFEAIIYFILDTLESQYSKIETKLLLLAKKEEPVTKDFEEFLQNTPHNAVAHNIFYENLKSSKWLPMLIEKGMFKNPPKTINVENGYMSPPWPILKYLSRMVLLEPLLCEKIIENVPVSANINVNTTLIEIAAKLPISEKVKLRGKFIQLIKQKYRYIFIDKQISAFILDLAKNKKIHIALQIVEEYMEIQSHPQPKGLMGLPNYPISNIDPWEYKEFIENIFPLIALHSPTKSVKLLCTLLNKYYKLKFPSRKNSVYEDLSFVGRPEIETTQRFGDDLENILISGIISLSNQYIRSRKLTVPELIAIFQKYRWKAFRRIEMYYVDQHMLSNKGLLAKYVTNEDYFTDFTREYKILIGAGFKYLTGKQKQIIYDWIEKAKQPKEYLKQHSPKSSMDSKVYIKIWQRDVLALLTSNLSKKWEKFYTDVSKDIEKSPIQRNTNSNIHGPVNTISADKIKTMTDKKVISLLKSWLPTQKSLSFINGNRDLSQELSIAIKQDIHRFIGIADKFIGLDSTYIEALLTALYEPIQNGIVFDWKPILTLCQWIVEKPIINSKEDKVEGASIMRRNWDRKIVASLLNRGLNRNHILYSYRTLVWKILNEMTDDLDPDSDKEPDDGASIQSLAMNSVRPDAISAVIQYALWVYRKTKEKDEKELLKGLKLMPEVKNVLDDHLKPSIDQSAAVRAVYGRYIPWLLLIDDKWTRRHIKDIFPSGQFNSRLYRAAWEGYLPSGPYKDTIQALSFQYLEAIDYFGDEENAKGAKAYRDQHLTEHIMLSYVDGFIEIEDENGIFTKFWNKANSEQRRYALSFIGRIIKDKPFNHETTINRLQKLWDYCEGKVENGDNLELSTFGWWFASNQLDENWRVKKLLNVLEYTTKIEAVNYVYDKLLDIVKKLPKETVKILEKLLINYSGRTMDNYFEEGKVKQILSIAISSSDNESKEAAINLINRLLAKGYNFFNDLVVQN